MVEPIQGAGGHRVAEPEFFRRLSALAHQYGVSLGFDEVQTAGGQTGTFFAIDQFDLPHPPTAVAVAKKLGNGAIYMLKPMDDIGDAGFHLGRLAGGHGALRSGDADRARRRTSRRRARQGRAPMPRAGRIGRPVANDDL